MLGTFVGGFVLIGVLWAWEQQAPMPLLPVRLFANGSFNRLVAIGFLVALVMFSGIFLLPLFFQLVFRANAAQSGWEIMPFLIATTIGSYVSGQWSRRLGRTRGLMVGGLAATAAGFLILGVLPDTVPLLLVVFVCFAVGIGIGFILPSSLVAIQNAAPRADVGAATATLLLLRAMGGAFGATLAGTILALRLGNAIDAFGHTSRKLATNPAVPAAFHLAFLIAAGFAAIGFAIALRVEDVALRDTLETEPEPIGH